MDLSTFGSI